MSKVIKNNTGSDVDVNDTGITVPGSGQYIIPAGDYPLWAASDDIITLTGDATLTVNDGSNDLTKAEGIAHLQGNFPQSLDLVSPNDFVSKVSANDTTGDYLLNKIVVADESNSTNALEVKEVNDAGDEDIKIAFDETKISITESQISDLGHSTDHGALSGLGDDDHSQYHNDTRGDARYYTETELDAGQLDNRYFTETEHINTSAGAGDAGKPVKLDAGGHIDASMINDGDVDHDNIANTHNLTTDIDHDQTTNYVANEHIDWTQDQGGTDIHSGNYTDTVYSHPNHTGEVTSTGDGVQVLDKTAITNRSSINLPAVAADSLLVYDASFTDIRKMTVGDLPYKDRIQDVVAQNRVLVSDADGVEFKHSGVDVMLLKDGQVGINETTLGINDQVTINATKPTTVNLSSNGGPIEKKYQTSNGTKASPTAITGTHVDFTSVSAHDGTSYIGVASYGVSREGTVATGSIPSVYTIDLHDGTSLKQPFKIQTDGTITVQGTTNYEDLVTHDDDIPNKKYVDDEIAGVGGGGSSITVEDEGTPLTTGVTKFNFAGAGVTVTEPVADEMLVTIPGGGAGANAGSAMRSAAPRAMVVAGEDAWLNSEDIESDAAVLENDLTNHLITAKEAGLYLMSFGVTVSSSTANIAFEVQSLKNGLNNLWGFASGNINGIVPDNTETHSFSKTMVVDLAADDEVSLEISGPVNGQVDLAWLSMTSLKGATGATGAQGADGDITWEGAWVSQNYTVNQAVKYTDGSSYVCKLNTVSSEIPTNTTYWDCLAESASVSLPRYRFVTATAADTTTSLTATQIDSMVINDLPAGTYLVMFSAEAQMDYKGNSGRFWIRKNTSIITSTIREVGDTAGSHDHNPMHTVACSAIVALNGTDDLTVVFTTVTDGELITVNDRSLTVIEVSATEVP